MKKRSNFKLKGFTLIELLAVIVILAIIAVIAIPFITSMISNSKKKAFETSVQIMADVFDKYSLENDYSKIKTEGITVQELKPYIKTKLIGGKYIEKDGVIEAEYVTDGEYCAKGPLNDLTINKDCASLDTTAAVYDEDKLHISFTSSTIIVTLDEGFASDPETGIKEYKVTVVGGQTKKLSAVGSLEFDGLEHDREYTVRVEIINGSNKTSQVERVIKTSKIDDPTYTISPSSGWAQSKAVTITYPNGYTNEYSLDSGNTWLPYTEAINFTETGTIIARVNDGTNYITGSSQTIGQIDTTKPETASFTYSTTSKSITVTASGTDDESEITHYQFSKDGGSTWLPSTPQTSNAYTFSNLTTGTYEIKVKVINGTYGNNGINNNNSLESLKQNVTTDLIDEPTYTISPSSGWAQSKTVTINYNDPGNTYTHKYSIDGGNTWNSYNSAIPFTANETIIARVDDGVNYVTASSQTISGIDRSTPTSASFTETHTTNSITVTASGTDAESGITHYQFSNDGGSTWVPSTPQTSSSYTFNNLQYGENGQYSIKVRVINGTYANEGLVTTAGLQNYKESGANTSTLTSLCTPTINITPSGWSQSKTVTISKENGCAGTLKYSTDGGSHFTDYESAITITTNNTTVIAKVTDGTNYKDASSDQITTIDRSTPTSASYTETHTSKSITLTASGADDESGITHYQFSNDGGSTWVPSTPQTSNSYTFNNLQYGENGQYSVKVKVYNGTYANNGVVTTAGLQNYVESSTGTVSLAAVPEPTYTISPSSGWSKQKVVTIDYKNSSYTHQYSLDNGISWETYPSGGVTFTANGTIIARNTDGTNYQSGSSQTISGVDTSAPTAAGLTHTETTNSITVTASGTDGDSGIYGYQFAITGKNSSTYGSWSSVQTDTSKTFSGLQTGTYKVKIRAINNTYGNDGLDDNYRVSDEATISLSSVCNSNKPTITATPSEWSEYKTVSISRPSGCTVGTVQYSTDGGNNFVDYSNSVTFTENVTIIARVTDGTNYVDSESTTITHIDRSTPTAASFTETHTTRSITVTANGTDGQSGITHYQFSNDGGANWTAVQSESSYTFSNLAYGENGQYSVKVRAINGTYANNGLCTSSSCSNALPTGVTSVQNYVESSAVTVTLGQVCTPTITVTPSGWAQSKTATISKGNNCDGTLQYSTDGGSHFTDYSSAISITTNNTTVIARLTDGTNYKDASSDQIVTIDRSAPTAATFSSTDITTKSFTIVASGTDSESNITHYQFSNDGGSTWYPSTPQTSNSYTFSNLSYGTNGQYSVKVRVINGTYGNNGLVTTAGLQNYTESAASTVTLNSIETPTFTVTPEGTAQSKTVTITYPAGSYTKQYSLDGGNTWQTYSSAIVFDDNGTIIARVTDGTNYKTSSELSVTGIIKATAVDISYSDTNTNMGCSDVKCAIEVLEGMTN